MCRAGAVCVEDEADHSSTRRVVRPLDDALSAVEKVKTLESPKIATHRDTVHTFTTLRYLGALVVHNGSSGACFTRGGRNVCWGDGKL
jgi:hypothetical protein